MLFRAYGDSLSLVTHTGISHVLKYHQGQLCGLTTTFHGIGNWVLILFMALEEHLFYVVFLTFVIAQIPEKMKGFGIGSDVGTRCVGLINNQWTSSKPYLIL